MTFLLETGMPGTDNWEVRERMHYENSTLDSGHYVSPAPTEECTIGPEPVLYPRRGIRLQVHGTEDDSGGPFIKRPDIAWGAVELEVPSGPNEVVHDRKAKVVAGPGDDDFKFTTEFKYWIDYI